MIEFVGDDTWNVYDLYTGEYAGQVFFEPHTGEYVVVAEVEHRDVGGFDTAQDAADWILTTT